MQVSSDVWQEQIQVQFRVQIVDVEYVGVKVYSRVDEFKVIS